MMTFFYVVFLIIGLAVFLIGMRILCKSLKELNSSKFKKQIRNATKNKYRGVLIGATLTAIAQSSSAVTVALVSFANSGLCNLREIVGVLMGANIGTTASAWIVCLSNANFNTKIPAIVIISAILFLLFFLLVMIKQQLANIFLGLAMLLLGIFLMSNMMYPFKDYFIQSRIISYCINPIIGILVGTILTAILQSSSVTIGILQALSVTGAVPFSVAIPIIAGANIGSCVTALISSIGTNKNAQATGLMHLYFNTIGSFIILALFYGVNIWCQFSFLAMPVNMLTLTIIHTAFNVISTIILLPFSGGLVLLSQKSVNKIKLFK